MATIRHFHNCKEHDDGKVTFEEYISSIGMYSLEGTFDNAIKNLKQEKENYQSEHYKKRYLRIYLDLHTPEYDSDNQLCIMGERLLTDIEMAGYKKYKEEQKTNQEDALRRDFERLKKLFPNG